MKLSDELETWSSKMMSHCKIQFCDDGVDYPPNRGRYRGRDTFEF